MYCYINHHKIRPLGTYHRLALIQIQQILLLIANCAVPARFVFFYTFMIMLRCALFATGRLAARACSPPAFLRLSTPLSSTTHGPASSAELRCQWPCATDSVANGLAPPTLLTCAARRHLFTPCHDPHFTTAAYERSRAGVYGPAHSEPGCPAPAQCASAQPTEDPDGGRAQLRFKPPRIPCGPVAFPALIDAGFEPGTKRP